MIKSEHEVYLSICNQIFEGQIRAETFIDIKRLSEKLNVSALPIRDALIRLASEDLLTYTRSKGYYLPKLDYISIQNAYTNMYILAKHSVLCLVRNSTCLSPHRIRLLSESQFEWTTLQPQLIDEFLEVAAATVMNDHSCRLFLHELRRTRPFRSCIATYRADKEEVLSILKDLNFSISHQKYRETLRIIKYVKSHSSRNLHINYELYNDIVCNNLL